ncbi:MAG: peptide deformylase [Planctomycetota bacterium]
MGDGSNPPLPDAKDLRLVVYPDPGLRRRVPKIETFDDDTVQKLEAIGKRMLEMMREHEGVGLAGPQAAVQARVFVMNATGEPDGDRVYVNPTLSDPDGEDEAEEGCLSLPDIRTPVLRATKLRMQAKTPAGEPIDETAEGFVARVWQHEVDHLDGKLILDRMPATVKMANRKKLRDLEAAATKVK